jgi:hypothetical protein
LEVENERLRARLDGMPACFEAPDIGREFRELGSIELMTAIIESARNGMQYGAAVPVQIAARAQPLARLPRAH